MTENRRIVLNIIATYGRNIYALVCGLFTARWALMALGEVDFGLYSLIGGLIVFVTFILNLSSVAISRFYAFSVGEARTASSPEEGLEKSREWFNTALLIHTVLPLIVLLIGYPCIEYAIRNSFFNIPPTSVESCVWVFRFTCLSSFVGMVTVPYNAMYAAKQYIAELTIYSFITTTLNLAVLGYMVTHPAVWLTRYAAWSAALSVLPSLIIAFRATRLFPECHFNARYLWSKTRVKKLFSFAMWQLFGCFGGILRYQGIAILINRYFGPVMNAANAISFSVAHHCEVLSSGMMTAFSPAITNACGAKDFERERDLAFRCCKIGTLLVLIFALPLSLEINQVLILWLKEPPQYSAGLCICILAMIVIDKLSVGHMLAVNAHGKIALYQAVCGSLLIFAFPLTWLFFALGVGIYGVGYAMIISMIMCSLARVYLARTLAGLSSIYWLRHIVLPLVLLSLSVVAIGLIPRVFLKPSFMRLVLTVALSSGALLPLVWFVLLSKEEKDFVKTKLKGVKILEKINFFGGGKL